MQRFIDFMVIEVRFFKKEKKIETWTKCYITTEQILYTGYFIQIYIIKSEINFKLKVKMNKILIYGFQWGETIAIPIYTVVPYCSGVLRTGTVFSLMRNIVT